MEPKIVVLIVCIFALFPMIGCWSDAERRLAGAATPTRARLRTSANAWRTGVLVTMALAILTCLV